MLHTGLLLLADSRLPAGGHAHSGGLEPAVQAGLVTDPASLADFLRGRLHTAGLTAAALAAAACRTARNESVLPESGGCGEGGVWERLEAEADARAPSPAQRRAARAQGRALLRAALRTWPHPLLTGLRAVTRAPHHPVVLGVTVAVLDGGPEDAAAVACFGAVTGPASAAVRLLGLDPLAVQRALAELAPEVDEVALEAACHANKETGWDDLPAVSAPLLDILAERHLAADLRLFES